MATDHSPGMLLYIYMHCICSVFTKIHFDTFKPIRANLQQELSLNIVQKMGEDTDLNWQTATGLVEVLGEMF